MKSKLITALAAAAMTLAVTASADEQYSTGEIRKIDSDKGRVTLRHGPIENLGMAPMTMMFQVVGDASLEGLQEGDQVEFRADREGSGYQVTEIRKAP